MHLLPNTRVFVGLVIATITGCRLNFDPLTGDASSSTLDTPSKQVWPNMAAGCPLMLDTSFDALPPAMWTLEFGVVNASDATAPYSKTVAHWQYDPGFVGGDTPGVLSYTSATLTAPSLRDLYVGVVLKLSSPWQPHVSSGFEFVYFVNENAGATSGLIINGSAPPYHMSVTYDGNILTTTGADPEVTIGEWHTLEVHRHLSTTTSSADGVIEWWFDGTLVSHHADVSFNLLPLSEVRLDPEWGGTGETKAETDYLRMDRIAICGGP